MDRIEYPRMDKRRDESIMLNGEWDFIFDDKNEGLNKKWYKEFPKSKVKINVPFVYQTKKSGINKREKHDVIWYSRNVKLEKGIYKLNFGAVDYECDVYIDGEHKIKHIGGETSFDFNFEIESDLNINITIRVFDPLLNEEIPRGKQFWEEESRGIWYTPTSGIWQSVWIDVINENEIIDYRSLSNVDTGMQTIKVEVNEKSIGKDLMLDVYINNEKVYTAKQKIFNKYEQFSFDMYDNQIFKIPFHSGGKESICWSPENPILYDIELKIIDDDVSYDKIEGYFGFRKIHIEDGITYLNNNPYYFKFVLDQGYWKDGLLTAPEDNDFVKDIELAKKMGFNGCRKHQKVEDPRFLYWADKLGFLVWGEVSSAPVFTEKSVEALQKSWFEIIKRDYNHPCIVGWVPLNESWGVPNIKFDLQQQAHSLSLYYQIKSVDNTRLVINNDGWEMTKTDVCAIHNYNHGNETETKKREYFRETMSTKENLLKARAAGKPVYANGFAYDENTPIMITEFGGIAYNANDPKGWGYTTVKNADELIEEYKRIIDVFSNSEAIFGFVYTQLCDVEQEINGLLTYDREPKCDLEKIKKINDLMFIKY